jgi:hypothetical protein
MISSRTEPTSTEALRGAPHTPLRAGTGAPRQSRASAALDAAFAAALRRGEETGSYEARPGWMPCGAVPSSQVWPRAVEEGVSGLGSLFVNLRRVEDPAGLAKATAKGVAAALELEPDQLEEFLCGIFSSEGWVPVDRVLERIDALDCVPGPHADLNFDTDYFASLADAAWRCRAARDRCVPPIPIFAMPKSGSVFVNRVLCELFDLPDGIASVEHAVGLRPWISFLGRFPISLHDHMWPSAKNLDLLQAAGVRQVGIQIRDPRQLIISRIHHALKYGDYGCDQLVGLYQEAGVDAVLQYVIDTELARHAEWLRLWRAARSRNIRIVILKYEDFIKDKVGFFLHMFEQFGIADRTLPDLRNLQATIDALDEVAKRDGAYNYRNGAVDEWRDVLSAAQQKRAEDAVSGRFDGLYDF